MGVVRYVPLDKGNAGGQEPENDVAMNGLPFRMTIVGIILTVQCHFT